MFYKTHIRWVKLFSKSHFIQNFKEGEICSIRFEDEQVLSVSVNQELKVFEKNCPHQKASLEKATCENGAVVCPWHKYAFDLSTGRDLSTSGNALKLYPTKMELDNWYVGIEFRLPFWMDPA